MSTSLRRLGAVSAVGLGALILTTVLAGPALAWHSVVTVSARCLDGQVRIHYRVESWEKGQEAVVKVRYDLNGTVTELPPNYFGPQHNQFSGHFDLSPDTTGTITFTAVAHWKGGEKSSDKGSDDLPPADKCEESTTTTSKSTTTTMEATTTTEASTTTSTTEPEVAPSSSLATTTTQAVGEVTSTTGGGQLPFTGASSGPMLLAGLALVGGGAVVLLVSRKGHATR